MYHRELLMVWGKTQNHPPPQKKNSLSQACFIQFILEEFIKFNENEVSYLGWRFELV